MPDRSPESCLSILLVEDHADTALVIGNQLAGMGHSVTTVASVAAAVRSVIDQKFDLIISDVGLPDGNGVSLMHGIRRFCDTPAIALTGYSSPEDIARCQRAGFDLHLAKPIEPGKLREAVEGVRKPG